MSIITQLRASTAESHTQLEHLLNLMDPDLTVDYYATVLESFSAVYPYLEASVFEVLATTAQADALELSQRRKTALLSRDLRDVGRAQVDAVRDLPVIVSADSALGAMYVLEGSTLGGQLICPHIRTKTGVRSRYFGAYGVKTNQMWSRFRSVCNEMVQDVSEAAASANDVFEAFRRAFCDRAFVDQSNQS